MAFCKRFCATLAALISCITMVHAQGLVVPTNNTNQTSSLFRLSVPNILSLPLVGVFNAPIQEDSNAIVSGPLYQANQTHYIGMMASNIVILSCDQSNYAGFVNADSVFNEALQASANVIVLYSMTSQYCSLSRNISTNTKVYSTKSTLDVDYLFNHLNKTSDATAEISSQGSVTNPAAGNDSNSNNNANNPLGPSPNTNVAMIILYAITGLITLLFMSIIVTGAVRAHRHPERYGLRAGARRPRQSRVRGVGKAILDSLPIVKFGEREDRTKPTDIEMTGGAHGPVEVMTAEVESSADRATATAFAGAQSEAAKSPPQPQSSEINEITAPHALVSSSNQGCSICTDDFEVGQDQRVLPCDHRFHPACIDPWLLNVSGTCPLCRIDLRPRTASIAGSDDGEQDGGDLAPPLEGIEGARTTIGRRSTLLSLIGNNRVSSMTREQRIVALREHRRRGLYRRSRGDAGNTDEAADVEEESNVRRRLRNAFRIRTRRIGEDDESRVDAASGPTVAETAPQPSSSTDEHAR